MKTYIFNCDCPPLTRHGNDGQIKHEIWTYGEYHGGSKGLEKAVGLVIKSIIRRAEQGKCLKTPKGVSYSRAKPKFSEAAERFNHLPVVRGETRE